MRWCNDRALPQKPANQLHLESESSQFDIVSFNIQPPLKHHVASIKFPDATCYGKIHTHTHTHLKQLKENLVRESLNVIVLLTVVPVMHWC